jgi:CDP-glucose 4,6-dehydratase
VASARAGNVLGGGDWSENRLLPDFARAYAAGEKVVLRNLKAVRPWQHVLDPLIGYMLVAEKLLQGERWMARAWNFGPDLKSCLTVEEILEYVQKYWKGFSFETTEAKHHEAKLLLLDSSQARRDLGWEPGLDVEESILWTLKWYQSFFKDKTVATERQIAEYLKR